MSKESQVDLEANVDTRKAAAYLGVSPYTLEKKRVTGGGPPFRKHFGRVVYAVSDLEEWSARRLRVSTTDPGLESQSL